ncbi:hypothetical protein [Pelomonas cellulosilytica]|uniref:DUF4124 domain-containing protein n=1 Tax=Pelomonas cellulosilytica TaxID=2906762 RepID=A0ABS8XWK9_9BURK|nr:hypothetical protein [Pelomonas sp. P8]MCE4557044.1 hypothetical protein [Pelomonas sp. P8]
MKPLLLVLVLANALPAVAQTQVRQAHVYRCGPEGRDLRDSPCPGDNSGSSSIAVDEPGAADTRAARDRHLSEAKQAAAVAAARRASDAEARHQRSQHVGLQTLPPPTPESGPQVTYLKPPKVAKPKKPSAAASHSDR